MRSALLNVTLLIVCLSCTNSTGTAKQSSVSISDASSIESPNIILIVSDDLGYGSLGSYGGRNFNTPNFDFWAKNGLRFTNFYVANPVCSPSRASILTGRTPQDAGVEKVLRPGEGTAKKGMDTNLPTFAELLQQEGYQTGLIGKWHLGYRTEEHPINRGFDLFKGFLGGAIDYLKHEYTIGGHAFSDGFKSWYPTTGKHATEIFTDEAVAYIQKDRIQPYCLLINYANPHRPFLLPGENNIAEENPHKRLNTVERYKKMVELLDAQIGKIQATIAEENQNTVIVFISDHGAKNSLMGNGELKGGKGDLYEGGIKVPAIIYWPNKISASSVVEDAVSVYDLYPTLLNLGRVKIADSLVLSGSLLIDENGKIQSNPRETMFWRHNGVKAVREGDWKALFIPTTHENVINRYLKKEEESDLLSLSNDFQGYIPLLYKLDDDPNEAFNLSKTHMGKLKALWRIAL